MVCSAVVVHDGPSRAVGSRLNLQSSVDASSIHVPKRRKKEASSLLFFYLACIWPSVV